MWLFFATPLIALFLMGVVHASESLDKIRLHWNEYRCNPIYIPFAGAIRPDIGVEENFQHCMNMFGQSIFRFVIDAIMLLFKDLVSGLSELTGPLTSARGIFSKIRNAMLSFAAQTFGKITNSMSSITYIIIKIRDVLKRFVGEGWIAVFLANTLIDSAVSFVMLCISIIKGFVYALLAISFMLALFQPEMLVIAIVFASMLGAAGFM
jgi:hypothetical protein